MSAFEKDKGRNDTNVGSIIVHDRIACRIEMCLDDKKIPRALEITVLRDSLEVVSSYVTKCRVSNNTISVLE